MMRKNCLQTGMSLVEVMIGGALLAGLGLVGAEMFKRQSAATKYAVARAELDQFHDKISKMLQDSRNCNANFVSSLNATTISAADLGTALYQCCPGMTATCAYDSSHCTKDNPLFTWPSNRKAFATIGQLVTPKTPSGFILQSMNITDAAGNPISVAVGTSAIVKAEIRVFYRKVDSAAASGVPDIMKRIPVAFKFRGTGPSVGFYGCVDAETGTKNTIQQELCKSLGASLATYDASTDKCVYNNTSATHNCGAGVLIGIDSNGNVICKTATSAFNEGQIIDPTSGTSCNSNSNVSFAWDAAKNTIKVICPP